MGGNAVGTEMKPSETPRMDAACLRAMATGQQGESFALELADCYRVEGRKLEEELSALKAKIEAAGREQVLHDIDEAIEILSKLGRNTGSDEVPPELHALHFVLTTARSHAEALAVQSEDRRKALVRMAVTLSELIQRANQAEAALEQANAAVRDADEIAGADLCDDEYQMALHTWRTKHAAAIDAARKDASHDRP